MQIIINFLNLIAEMFISFTDLIRGSFEGIANFTQLIVDTILYVYEVMYFLPTEIYVIVTATISVLTVLRIVGRDD